MGHSVHVLVRDGKLQFGTWQGVYLCEFDRPEPQFVGDRERVAAFVRPRR